MADLLTVRLILRVLHAPTDNDFVDLTRTIDVAEMPRVGDTIYLDPAETASRKVIAREWGYDGSPSAKLAAMSVANDINPSEGEDNIKILQRNGWKVSNFVTIPK